MPNIISIGSEKKQGQTSGWVLVGEKDLSSSNASLISGIGDITPYRQIQFYCTNISCSSEDIIRINFGTTYFTVNSFKGIFTNDTSGWNNFGSDSGYIQYSESFNYVDIIVLNFYNHPVTQRYGVAFDGIFGGSRAPGVNHGYGAFAMSTYVSNGTNFFNYLQQSGITIYQPSSGHVAVYGLL